MKKLLLILLVASPAWGAITPAQIESARTATREIGDELAEMRTLIQEIYPLVTSGNTYQLALGTGTVSLTAAQQQEIVDQYNAIKARMQASFQKYP